jgi:hypothetical protein
MVNIDVVGKAAKEEDMAEKDAVVKYDVTKDDVVKNNERVEHDAVVDAEAVNDVYGEKYCGGGMAR